MTVFIRILLFEIDTLIGYVIYTHNYLSLFKILRKKTFTT